MTRTRLTVITLAIVANVAAAILVGCGSGDNSSSGAQNAGKSGQDIADNREAPKLSNDVEGKNYYGRLRFADNPTSILWCTEYPTSPNAKAFTVPIVGKLTSGGKRPISTSRAMIDTDTTGKEYSPEKPGPDGMYGSSGDFRYGFDPAGNYHEFWNLESYCTSVPNVIQKETTRIMVGDPGAANLASADAAAQAALRRCQTRNKDMTVRCPEAAKLLGLE